MKPRPIISIVSFLTILVTLLCVYFHYPSSLKAAVDNTYIAAETQIAENSVRIEAHLIRHRNSVKNLATFPELQQALVVGDANALTQANALLDHYRGAIQNGVCFLMDSSGRTISSSNRKDPDSLLGKNHASRPYFQQAINGIPLTYMSEGVKSKPPKMYYSQPVYDKGRVKPIGVVVIGVLLDAVHHEAGQLHRDGIWLLTDQNGVVLHSNQKGWTNKVLWRDSSEAHEQITTINQFGEGPLHWTGLEKVNENTAIDSSGKRYMIYKKEIASQPGWNSILLYDYLPITQRISAVLLRPVGLILPAICIFVGALVLLLTHIAHSEFKKRKQAEKKLAETHEKLELQVEKRTHVLQTENKQLTTDLIDRKNTPEELIQSYKTLSILNTILRVSMETPSLTKLLEQFIHYITSLPELELLPRGAIFLSEEKSKVLILTAQQNMPAPLLTTCSRVPYGKCPCGRAAQAGEVLFADCVDERCHDKHTGMTRHRQHYCVPILSSHKKVLGVFTVNATEGTVKDERVMEFLLSTGSLLAVIIQYKQAEQAQREADTIHRAITATAHDAIIMMNDQGGITYWNPAAARIFGYKDSEVMGRDLHRFLAPHHDHEKYFDGIEKFAQTGQGEVIGKNVELSAIKKDGTEFPIELSLSAIHIGNQWAAVGIVRDISLRKKTEEERTKLQLLLRHAQKMEALGTLASGIAHDFNNILTSILGYAELLQDEIPDKNNARQDLEQVLNAGRRAKNLVRQILTFSRQTEQELQPVQVNLIVNEALKLLRASIPSTIEIRQHIENLDTTVLADPTQIHQILMNLSTNAYRAMSNQGGVLEVRLDTYSADDEFFKANPEMHENNYLRLTVSDTGCGMAPNTLERIFEPYFSTKKKEDSTGLGLAVVHGIVSSLGGAISVESKLGSGSSFHVYFPIVAESEAEKDQVPIAPPQGSEHILFVDDEAPIAKLGHRLLQSLGYSVTYRTASIEALDDFRNQPDEFDLVITDQTMPDMTGIKLAEELLSIRSDIPIVLCTGYEELIKKEELDRIGIQEFIMKPVAKDKLASVVRDILDK